MIAYPRNIRGESEADTVYNWRLNVKGYIGPPGCTNVTKQSVA